MHYKSKWETFDAPLKGLATAQNGDMIGDTRNAATESEEFNLAKEVIKSNKHKLGLTQSASRDAHNEIYR
jgi:hypothetical protein